MRLQRHRTNRSNTHSARSHEASSTFDSKFRELSRLIDESLESLENPPKILRLKIAKKNPPDRYRILQIWRKIFRSGNCARDVNTRDAKWNTHCKSKCRSFFLFQFLYYNFSLSKPPLLHFFLNCIASLMFASFKAAHLVSLARKKRCPANITVAACFYRSLLCETALCFYNNSTATGFECRQ